MQELSPIEVLLLHAGISFYWSMTTQYIQPYPFFLWPGGNTHTHTHIERDAENPRLLGARPYEGRCAIKTLETGRSRHFAG